MAEGSVGLAGRILEDPRALPALAEVARAGKDKGRGNAAQAIGALCDSDAARDGGEVAAAREHQGRAGRTDGCLAAVVGVAADGGDDAKAQALAALSRAVRRHRENAGAASRPRTHPNTGKLSRPSWIGVQLI
jgi:hypothetical protein